MSDVFLRFTRRSMMFVLLVIVSLGVMGVATTLQPNGPVARAFQRASWMIPIGIVIAVVALQSAQRKHRFTADSPEVRAVMTDELRRASMDRARFVALLVVLVAQVPLALLLSQTPRGLGFAADLPAFRAVMAMAVSTITLGMSSLIVSFLVFDRD